MSGHPPTTRKTRSTCLRSDLSNRVRPTGLKLVSLSLCTIQPHRALHGENLTTMWSLLSKFQNWYDTCTCSRLPRLIVILAEGYKYHSFSEPSRGAVVTRVGINAPTPRYSRCCPLHLPCMLHFGTPRHRSAYFHILDNCQTRSCAALYF